MPYPSTDPDAIQAAVAVLSDGCEHATSETRRLANDYLAALFVAGRDGNIPSPAPV